MTPRGVARRAVGALPPLRRRDTLIRELRERLRTSTGAAEELRERVEAAQRELEGERGELATAHEEVRRWRRMVEQPSWGAQVRRLRRVHALTVELPDGEDMPIRSVSRKLANYRLAASHGVATPEVLAVWPEADRIELEGLPEAYTLKADRGAASRAVFPVRRRGDRLELADGSRSLTPEELVGEMDEAGRTRAGLPPYFAEELLEDAAGSALPVDIKVYTFYGEVGHVLLRAVDRHGDPRGTRRRYLLPDGSDLLPDNDRGIPAPRHLDAVLDTAQRLSTVAPFPFLRVDLYDTPRGVVIGELTMAPGGPQRYPHRHDRHLGDLFERAEARLYQDLYDGRPYAFLYGDQPTDHLPDVRHAPDAPLARWSGGRRRA